MISLRETRMIRIVRAQRAAIDAAYHRGAWDGFREGMKQALAEAGFKQRGEVRERSISEHAGDGESAAADGGGIGQPRAARPVPLRFHPGRVHKAGSAESILKHCLRQLGVTKRWWAGRLTTRQAVRLLRAIREYGRAWLRHEAEGVVASIRIGRGIRWTDQPDGFLHAEETGVRARLGRFFGRAKQFVREVIVAGAMSILGPAPLTGEELEAAEREAQKQSQYFDRFEAETVTPTPTPMTPKQFVARVEKYGNAVHQAAQRINHAAAAKAGVATMARRVLGHPRTEHCDDCPPLAAMGWQPIGTLPQIGDTECGPRCLCHFEFMDKDGHRFVQGKMGPVPKLTDTVDMEPDDGGVYPIAGPPIQ